MVAAFISRLIDGFVARVHLVDEAFIVAMFLLALSSRKLIVSKAWIACMASLYFAAVIGLATPELHTNFWIMPSISAYHSVGEFLVAVMYETRYMVAMGILLGCGLEITQAQWEQLVTFVIMLLALNAFFSIFEYQDKGLHAVLLSRAGYAAHYSFVYRGVSLLMNAYDASISMLFLVALSAYRWLAKRQLRYLFLIGVGSVTQLLLGTRTGYIAMAGYFVIISFMAPVALRTRILRAGTAISSLLLAFALLAFFDVHFKRIVISIVTLSDSKGSAQLHVALFWKALQLIAKHPLGVGLGKANFGALRHSFSFEPESYALALGLDGGILAMIAFYYFNANVFMAIRNIADPAARAIVALGLTLLALSWISLQVFGSSFVLVFLPVIVAGMKSKVSGGAEAVA
jgi:hypothetical protein